MARGDSGVARGASCSCGGGRGRQAPPCGPSPNFRSARANENVCLFEAAFAADVRPCETVFSCLLSTVSFHFPFALSSYFLAGGSPAALVSFQLIVVTQVLITWAAALEAKGHIWLLSNGRTVPWVSCGGSCPKLGTPAWERRLHPAAASSGWLWGPECSASVQSQQTDSLGGQTS